MLLLLAFLAAPVPMLDSNNALRAIHHRAPLVEDPRLSAAAQEQAEHLARIEHYPHVINGQLDSGHYRNGTPRTRAMKHGFRWAKLGENIAQETDHPWEAWRESAPHFRTLLGDYEACGFGRAVSPTGKVYWVAVYGTEL